MEYGGVCNFGYWFVSCFGMGHANTAAEYLAALAKGFNEKNAVIVSALV